MQEYDDDTCPICGSNLHPEYGGDITEYYCPHCAIEDEARKTDAAFEAWKERYV